MPELSDEQLMAIAAGSGNQSESLRFSGTTGRSARNNNPLNIEYRQGSYQDKYGAKLEPEGRFAVFPDMMSGYQAGLDQIRLDQQRGLTLAQFVEKFSPAHENPTAQLIASYAKQVGAAPNTPLAQIPPENLIVPMLARESSTKIVGQPVSYQQGQSNMSDDELMRIAGQGAPSKPTLTLQQEAAALPQASPEEAQQAMSLLAPQPQQGQPQQGQPGQVQSIPDLIKQALSQDPTAAMVNNLTLPPIEPETAVGMIAGAKGPMKITAPLTGMALAATGGIKRAYEGKQETYQPQDYALMEQGLPAVSGEMGRDFAVGAGLDVLGGGIAKVAGKLLGKVGGPVKEIVEWARQKKIPYPGDIGGSKLGKLAENLPDIGMGTYVTRLRRHSTSQKLTEAVGQIADDVGLPLKPANDVGQDLALMFNGLINGSVENSAFKGALRAMNPEVRHPMHMLKETIFESFGDFSKTKEFYAKLDKMGGRMGGTAEEDALKQGMGVIERVYGKKGQNFVDAIKEIADNNWTASPKNLETLTDMVHLGIQRGKKGWADVNIEKAKGAAEKIKQGFLEDMEDIASPGGQALSELYLARNKAYSEAMQMIGKVNPQLKLFYEKDVKGRMRYVMTHTEKNFEDMAERLFSPGNINQAKELKQYLENMGRQDIWDTAKMAWIKKGFDNSMIAKEGETFFSPTKYKSWYDGNRDYISKIMPEQVPALEKWHGISNAFEADMKRFASSGPRGKLGAGLSTAGAAMSYFTGGTGGVVVPQATSFLSALSVLPGVVRMYLPAAETTGLRALKQAGVGAALEVRGRND